MRAFIRQLRPALMAIAVFTVLFGVVYPMVTTGIGQVAFSDKADGSLIRRDGVVVGSELIGQTFTAPEYFHSRPSAAGAGYDGAGQLGLEPWPAEPRSARRRRGACGRLPRGERPRVPTCRCPSTQ